MHRERYPQITLSDAERAKYDQSARIFLLETMAERGKFDPEKIDPKQWEYVRRREEMRMYHSVQGTPDPNVLLMLGTGLINSSIEDVMSGLYCDTTEDLCTAKTLLGYSLAGGAVMNVSERHSTKDPYRFAGIKWFSNKSVWGLLRDRDVLTYERMGLTVDADGEEWAYHTLQSIRRPEWPMEAVPGMQRQHTATCYLYRPRRDLNKTEIFLWGSIYKFGKYPDKVIYYGVARTWLNVVNCPRSGHAKKFSALIERADSHGWTASSKSCHVCSKQPLLGSNSACSGCHQSVCKDCSRQKDIFALDAKRKKPERRIFCILCIKSVIGSAHWSVDDHIEASSVESEPKTISTCESVGSIRSDSLLGDRQLADPFRPRVASSPTSNVPVLGAQGPLDPNAQLVLDCHGDFMELGSTRLEQEKFGVVESVVVTSD
ncbi:E3 ubiquitin-protein ligase rbbp6 [Phytophthora boehmeriae]|uniref:E3 ubiquitin-protein ligase rbbp6 n=1 Tax=Phytophthora boehmeriae TaxID=109152 RepID=A0A8T1WYT0_9STRA|nr:E3 ubiquitin-protein ligase rbbp6 [Phytophthora boehmeriae]